MVSAAFYFVLIILHSFLAIIANDHFMALDIIIKNVKWPFVFLCSQSVSIAYFNSYRFLLLLILLSPCNAKASLHCIRILFYFILALICHCFLTRLSLILHARL